MSDTPSAPAPETRPQPSRRAQEARRRFLRSMGLTGGVIGLSLLGYYPTAQAHSQRLRPPGALDESDFLSSCIKCGQCVQVCPVQAIKLGDITDGFGIGVPFINAREQACDFSCDAVQCILACPTGALTYKKPAFMPPREGAPLAAKPLLKAKAQDAENTLNLKERFGLAKLVKPEACLAVQGKGFKGTARGAAFKGQMRYMAVDRWKPIPVANHPYDLPLCDLCVRECPIGNAISLEETTLADGRKVQQPVVHEPCVGCGVCEMICPAEQVAIVIEPWATWKEGV